MIVSAVDSKKGTPMEWIKLSKTFSNNCLPIERKEIVTSGKIERWEYLKPSSSNFWQDRKMGVFKTKL